MAGRIAVAGILLATALIAALACAGRRIHSEAALVEAELTKRAVGDLERTVKQGVSTSGRDIKIVTSIFLIDQPVFDFREEVNTFLLDRGYAQSSNISTPTEFSVSYDGLNGLIHVEIMAEVAQPPSSFPTELPEPETGGTTPSPDSLETDADNNESKPAKGDSSYHRVTVQISY